MTRKVEVEFTGKDELSSKVGGISGALKKVGVVAAGVFTGEALTEGVKKVAEGLKSCLEAAVDDEASQRKLALALKNTTGANDEQIKSVDEWLGKTSEQYGVSKDDLMPAFQRLAESTGSVSKAQKEMSIAMDVSAGTGKNLNVVTAAMMKANNGTTAALSRLGLKTKDAQGNTLSLNQAMAQMAQTFHGQAEARANSLQGKMDRLHSTMHELEVRIGQKLIPVVSALASFFLNKVMPATSALFSFLSNKLSPSITQLGNFIKNRAVPALSDLWQWVRNKLVPAIGSVLTPILRNVRGVFDQVRDSVSKNKPQLEQLWSGFSKVATFVATKVAPILLRLAGSILIHELGTSLKAVITLVSGLVKGIDAVVSAVQSLISWFGRIKIPDALSKAGGLIGSITSHIPGHADGGVTSGGLVKVGERGPEYVALPRGSRVIPNGQARNMGTSGGGGVGEVAVNLRLEGQTIERLLIRYQRDTGEPLQVTTI